MKLRAISICGTLALLALSLASLGCGSKNNAIATTVTLTSSVGSTLIVGQSTTITATVTGPTNTDVTWSQVTYTTTTIDSTGKSTTSSAQNLPSDGSLGTISNQQTTGTATFLAPPALPDPTKFPGLVITITAVSVADTSKKGTIGLSIDSGISVSLQPATAAVPTNEKQPFFAVLTNDLKNQGVTWLLTQQTPTSSTTSTNTNIFASLATCTVSGNATGCGSIDQNGVYTAPTAVPTVTVPANTPTAPTDSTTPQILTVVATSKGDPTRFAIGTITITQGGPITFNGISPTIAPQGSAYWDIYLNAPGISSATQITLTDANNGTTQVPPTQIKVLFPIPTSTVTNPTSTGARIRLNAANLANTGPVTVSVADPGEPVTQCTGNPLPSGCNAAGTFAFNIMPVRPTVSFSTPPDIVQNTVAGVNPNIRFTIDGGYFGDGGQLAQAIFQGTTLAGTTNGQGTPLSGAKQLQLQFPSTPINTGLPGLYSLSVSRSKVPVPFTNNAAISNLAVFPSFATDPPKVIATLSTGASTNPSAIDIDPALGVAVVAETSANAVQFYTIGSGTLTPIGAPVAVGKTPTGVSVNRTNHTVAVVNYSDQTITVLPIPGAAVQAPGTPFTFSLSGVLQGAVNPAPLPYSIGVDPDTNMGVVAYSSTSSSSASNLGFLIDLNPNGTSVCIPFSGAPSVPPCAYAQVTLNSGAYPQVAMAPHGHLAYVSPGGSGAVRGIDVTKPSSSVGIESITLAAGIATVTTTLCPTNIVTNPAQLLFPGNTGTVLITGVPTSNSAGNTNFNGVYTANAVSDNSFTFISPSTQNGTVTITNSCGSSSPANVFFNSPNLIFGGISPTAQGIAINPISNTAALADANATGSNAPEINILNALDQAVSDISFFSMCTFYTTTCSNGPELLGTTNIAWQPYSNSIVSYNPTINQVSVSDPSSLRRYALACELKTGTASACITDPATQAGGPLCANISVCSQQYLAQASLQGTGTTSIQVTNGTTGNLTLWGGLAVDPPTNQAFVVMSGSSQIDIVDLGPCKAASGCVNPSNALKPAQISEILVPSPTAGFGAIGGVPNATVPQGTLTSASDLVGVQVFGSGFDASTSVRLDGTALPGGNVTFVSSRQLTITVPAAFLSFPHRYALDLINGGGSQSNPVDFLVIKAVDMSQICPNVLTAGGVPVPTQPSSVAIADQLANGPFSPIAVVTNSGCNNIAVIDINPTSVVNNQTVQNPNFGKILNTVAVGQLPQGIAVSQPFGLAIVANNSDGTASVVNLLTNALAVPSIATGTNPTGVAINDATGAAIVANTGSNTISEINLSLLFGSSPATSLTPVSIGGFQQPTAVAIDPDRGTSNQGIAVVTSLLIIPGAPPSGALAVADIGAATPTLSTTIPAGAVIAPSTGIVFDPTVATGTANPGIFYASSSGGNVITQFNPDTSTGGSVNVGINPTALAINPQTGAIVTTNVAGKTTSLVDTTSTLKTVQTIGLPGSPQFGVAIDQFTNLAVLVDQANNRLFILPASK